MFSMGLFGKKSDDGGEAPQEKYTVVYKGGHPDLPKAKSGGIQLLLMADEFQFNPTMASKSYWNPVRVPYDSVNDVRIVARQVGTFETVLAGMDAKQLNQDNNLHVDYVDDAGRQLVLRFEMLTGTTVMGQAKKCREFEDRLRNLGIRARFRASAAAPAGTAPATDITDQIAKLAALRDQGILTDEEFSAKKAELLSRL
jgi:hypothetical protein